MVRYEDRPPMIHSRVWIREGSGSPWIKTYMVLKDNRLFVVSNMETVIKFMRAKTKNEAYQMVSEVFR